MNERIKTLFIKAGGAIEEENGNLWTYSDDLDPKEFAELIVRECVGICHKMAEDSDSYVVHDGDTCAEQIKKHFGVTE
jgi:hypothetical protein